MTSEVRMTGMWPIRIYQDRYGGSYCGGGWVAVHMDNKTMEISDIENGILGGDVEVREFWITVAHANWIAVGQTPNDALAAYRRSNSPNPVRPAESCLKQNRPPLIS